MKVVFKLNAAQLKIAGVVLSELAQKVQVQDDDGNLIWKLYGNMNEQCYLPHPSFNEDQFLELQGNKLTYRGQRCPLHDDGGLAVIAKIAGYEGLFKASKDRFSTLEVAEYHTSDARLKWYETLAGYMHSRGTPDEYLLYSFNEYDPNWSELPARFVDEHRLIDLLRNGETAKASAEFDSAKVSLVRKLLARIEELQRKQTKEADEAAERIRVFQQQREENRARDLP